jgi:tetratricopeptide (TPR) repeat protein
MSSGPSLSVPAGVAIIAVLVFVAYLPALNGGFILDDDVLLTKNPSIKAPDGLFQFWCTTEPYDYWPATNTALWIEWRIWAMNSAGYHVTNLILHVVESLLIWIILRKLSVPGAFLAAVIFALHPVNVESAAWIAQRKNMMSLLFFLLSILWYIKAHMPTASVGMAPGAGMAYARSHGGPWEREKTYSSFILHPSSFHFWYWLSLAAFVLAMLSKGSAAILPILLLAIVWWLRLLCKRELLRVVPFFVVAAVLTGVNLWFQSHGEEVIVRNADFTERVLGAGAVVWFYLYKAILPFDLAFIYPQWQIEHGNPLWWLPLVGALAVTAVLWRYRKSWSRPLLFAWGFFCAALVPVMGFTDVGFMKYSLVADHYQHIAIIGVIALAAASWSVWWRRARGGERRAATVVAVMVAGTLAFLTYRQSEIYRDNITLYTATLEKNPNCWMAQNNLGNVLIQAGRPRDAIEHCQRALELNFNYAKAHYNLGTALKAIGQYQQAIDHYEQALKLEPDYAEVHYNYGNIFIHEGQPLEAIEHYRHALQSKPNFTEAHNNLGIALADIDRFSEAIEHYNQALILDPGYAEAHNNLGCALDHTGRLHDAIEQYEQAIRLKPDYDTAYSNLVLAYAKADRSADAIAAARKAIELARSKGRTAQAEEIENWLNSYNPLPTK